MFGSPECENSPASAVGATIGTTRDRFRGAALCDAGSQIAVPRNRFDIAALVVPTATMPQPLDPASPKRRCQAEQAGHDTGTVVLTE